MSVRGARGRLNDVVDPRALAAYTCLFVLAACAMYGPMLVSGRTLIRTVDGLDQHYPFFLYIGKWIRATVRALLSGTSLPGVWNMDFGYGADMRVSLGAYAHDPFNWLSALVPTRFSEAAFVLTVPLRLWCAGMSFLVYARYRQYGTSASVVAALLYSTCGVTLVAPIETFFVNPLITFPLVVRGMLEVMDGGRPTLFVCSLAATFCVYFYFGYMTCILVVPAWLGECVARGARPRDAARQLAAFLGYSLLGVALSAAVVLPIAKVVLHTGRLGIERPQQLLYDAWYYRKALAGIAGWAGVGPDSYIGFGAVGALSALLLLSEKGRSFEKVMLGAYTAVLLLPQLGRALNGFAYITNRWTWAYAFAFASCAASCLPDALRSERRTRVVSLVAVAYAAWMLWIGIADGGTNFQYVLPAAVLLAVVAGLTFVRRCWTGDAGRGAWAGLCTCTVIVCSGVATTSMFMEPTSRNGQVEVGTALASVTDRSPYRELLDVAPIDARTCDWRADNLVPCGMSTALLNGARSYDYYISIYNDNVDRFHSLLGISGTQQNVKYKSLDSRPGLELALGTRYMIVPDGQARAVPYGFGGPIGVGAYGIYESDAYQPIASLREREVAERDFLAATMAERETMLRDAVVVEGAKAGGPKAWEPPADVSLSATAGEGCAISAGVVEVGLNGGWVDLAFDAVDGATYYLELEGCSFSPVKDTGGRWISFSELGGDRIATLGLMSPLHHMDGGKRDWVVNLGRLPEGRHTVRATFSHAGTYSFASARLVAMSSQSLDKARAEAREHMGDVTTSFGTDLIDCSVKARADSMLVVTTPWSEGWSATMDGEPVELEVVDVAFMGVKVPAGEHEVSLRYRTPGLMAGTAISVAAAAVTVLLHRRAGKRAETGQRDASGEV